MKTYCKDVELNNENKVFDSISKYISSTGKYKQKKMIRFISQYSNQSRKFCYENYIPGNDFFTNINTSLAKEMADAIKNRTVEKLIYKLLYNEKVILYRNIKDPGSKKIRTLGLESVLFRLFEAVAKDGAEPMFKAKLGQYQVASIKGRGQNYGRKAIIRWTSRDPQGTRYFAKADICQCYPSISHDILLSLLKRDLRKCPDLIYLFELFIKLYSEYPKPGQKDANRGILIGSPVSKDLCNYYLSYLYHYLSSEALFVTRKTKNGLKKVRLIKHIIFYMDDIVIFGSDKKNVIKAMMLAELYLNTHLALTIKPNWQISKFQYKTNGKFHGSSLDFMGYVFHRNTMYERFYGNRITNLAKTWTTIRPVIFLRSRRVYRRFLKMIVNYKKVSSFYAMGVCSRYGWFKYSDSYTINKKEKIQTLVRVASRIVSDYAKEKKYNRRKYYHMLRRLSNGKKSFKS